jgi:hypothetical protein
MLPQPAVPTSTTAYTNTTGQTACVTVIGGTVTSINVNGTQVATATNYMATVAAGQTIAITYSAVPAWYWSTYTPAVPSSATAAANPTGKPLYVILAGGTVSAVSVNGTSVATSSPANFALPAGESVTLTYSGAPVWAWLDFPWLASPPSTGTAYAQENTVPPSGVSGYSPVNDLPYAAHAEGGEPGLAVGVSN